MRFEHKFWHELSQIIDTFREPIEIIALVVDKRVILRPPDDPENIYREVVSLAIRQVVSRWPRIEIHLDKRYTSKRLRRLLEREIRERIADLHQEVVLIHQDDSIARKELQAADFIAWQFSRNMRETTAGSLI